MKSIIPISALAVIILAGCAKQETVPSGTSEERAIEFSPYVDRPITKSDISLTTAGFRVSAYPTSSNTAYFENVDFSWDSAKSRYTSSTTKYWPLNGTLGFYAVSPKMNISSKKVAFTGIDGATDFCAASRLNQSYSESGTTLTFGHKLTKLVFRFTGDKLTGTGANTNLSYVISEVKISALGTSTYDISTDTWTTPTTSKTYTVTTNGSTAFTATLNSSKATSDNSYALYLLPGQAATSGTVVLSVKYKVLENGKVIDNKYLTNAATLDLSANANTYWVRSNSIIYTINLAPSSSATAITFSANTSAWDSDTIIDAEYPATNCTIVYTGPIEVNLSKIQTKYPGATHTYDSSKDIGKVYVPNLSKMEGGGSWFEKPEGCTMWLPDEVTGFGSSVFNSAGGTGMTLITTRDRIWLPCDTNKTITLGNGTIVSVSIPCFAEGTMITLSDGSRKPIEKITYEDELKVWNFDKGREDNAKILWISESHQTNKYYRCEFSDGTVLKLIGDDHADHRVFNYTDKCFEYASDIECGKEVFTENGIVKKVRGEWVEEAVNYYNLITDYHINCYIEGILSSCRYSNLYPIDDDLKYIKDDRKKRPYREFKEVGISREWYNGMRLGEQPYDREDIGGYFYRCQQIQQPKEEMTIFQKICQWFRSIF